MTKQTNKPKSRARTYARNRTANVSRRGYEKVYQSDGAYFAKLMACIVVGAIWLRFSNPIVLGPLFIPGVPVGLLLGAVGVYYIEKYQMDRKNLYIVLVVAAMVSFFLPTGIVI